MSEADAVAVILWLGATLYAVFGGADFGGGFWDLTAGWTEERGGEARDLIARAITPVWEANHVWLIFVLVVLWTGFPTAFAAIMSTLYVPLCIAALGIVLRGSGFAFREVTRGLAGRRALGATFALSSVLTPFAMGTVVGAIASGRVPARGTGDRVTSWLNLTSLTVGALFVATGAYLAAVFLVQDARRMDLPHLERAFARRALGAALVAGVLAILGLMVLRSDARPVFDGITSDGLPLVVVSALAGGAALVLLVRRRYALTRPLAVLAVVAIVWGWGAGQRPYLLPTSLTIEAGAASDGSLTALLVVFAAAIVIVGPALTLLYLLQRRSALEEAEG